MRLPNKILGPVALLTLVALAVVSAWSSDWNVAIRSLGGGLLAGGTFWLLSLLTRNDVGVGDAKLAAVLGLVAGSVSLAVAWCSLLIAAALALIWTKALRRAGPVPFGPWLLVGGWLSMVSSG